MCQFVKKFARTYFFTILKWPISIYMSVFMTIK